MSDEKESTKTRSLEEIQQEYQGVCCKAGHSQYQVHVYQLELERLNAKLRELNMEAANASAQAVTEEQQQTKEGDKENG